MTVAWVFPGQGSQKIGMAKQIDRELRQVQKQKEESVRDQNFDQAGQLREKEMELSAKIKEVLEN